MSGIAISGSAGALLGKFQKISTSGMQSVSRALSEHTLSLVKRTANAGTDPYGNAWAPLKMRSGRPLRNSSALLNSLALLGQSPSSFTIGTSLIYASVHQRGATIRPKTAKRHARRTGGRKGGWVFAKEVTIPARPFLPTGGLPGAWESSMRRTSDRILAAVMR